jgi:thymidylate synthase
VQPNYLPYDNRLPDTQYQHILRSSLPPHLARGGKGEYLKNEFQPKGRYSNFGMPVIEILFENGFPLITERKIGFWRKFINEMMAFVNGARTLEELRQYGTDKTWPNFWEKWVYAEKCAKFGLSPGDLGDGSYAVLGKYPTPDGPPFNQFLAMIEQARKFPSLTTHMITSWMPAYALGSKSRERKVVVAPCHGNLVRIIVNNGRLTLQHVQRSADMPVGAVGNLVGYASIALAIARELQVEPYRYVHSFMDAHTYEDQINPWVNELLSRQPRPFPTMRIANDAPTDILALRGEHFELADYDPHPAMNDIPVTE